MSRTDIATPIRNTPDVPVAAEVPFSPEVERPTWEIAPFFPHQGRWTAADYFHLEDFLGDGFRAELVEGRLEVLPMPKLTHQRIIAYLYRALFAWIQPESLGEVLMAGIRVRVRNGEHAIYREPDIVFMRKENGGRKHEDFWDGADLVMEVVSDDPRDVARDYEIKPAEYAAAGIPEYWIIDPAQGRIRVLVLEGATYRLHGDFLLGSRAAGLLLPGFALDVAEALAGGES